MMDNDEKIKVLLEHLKTEFATALDQQRFGKPVTKQDVFDMAYSFLQNIADLQGEKIQIEVVPHPTNPQSFEVRALNVYTAIFLMNVERPPMNLSAEAMEWEGVYGKYYKDAKGDFLYQPRLSAERMTFTGKIDLQN